MRPAFWGVGLALIVAVAVVGALGHKTGDEIRCSVPGCNRVATTACEHHEEPVFLCLEHRHCPFCEKEREEAWQAHLNEKRAEEAKFEHFKREHPWVYAYTFVYPFVVLASGIRMWMVIDKQLGRGPHQVELFAMVLSMFVACIIAWLLFLPVSYHTDLTLKDFYG